ncbi:MAG: hypothetical protein WBA77_18335 [Microcoleaceae cyanobacterium]
MESDSKPPRSFNTPSSTFADIFGAAIALLTLVIPLLVILRYSQPPVSAFPSTPYSIQQLNRNQQ